MENQHLPKIFVYSKYGPSDPVRGDFFHQVFGIEKPAKAEYSDTTIVFSSESEGPLPMWALRVADNHLRPASMYQRSVIDAVVEIYHPPQYYFHGIHSFH